MRNHAPSIVACDFLVSITTGFRVLHVLVGRFFAMQDLHDRGDLFAGGVTGEAADGYSGSVAADATKSDLLRRSELVTGTFHVSSLSTGATANSRR